jgi:hypothetical protein
VRAEWTQVLSFLLFSLFLTIGQAIKFQSAIKIYPIVNWYHEKAFRVISWRMLNVVLITTIIAIDFNDIILTYFVLPSYFAILRGLRRSFELDPNGYVVQRWIAVPLLSQLPLVPVAILVVSLSHHRLQTAVVSLLIIIFWTIIIVTPIQGIASSTEGLPPLRLGSGFEVSVDIVQRTMWAPLILILLSVAPAKAISRRLIFLALGLLLLIALNEISELGLDLTAPKL